MINYLALMEMVLEHGEKRQDRTGTGTRSIFGAELSFNLQYGFPIVTTKRVHMHSVIHELLWFLKGDTNTKYLNDNNVRIWDEWADPAGDLGPVYGKQWRSWGTPDGKTIDQMSNVVDSIKTNPLSRRHIVSAWNVGELDQMALPPCHLLFQFYVRNGVYLDCQLYQRSADVFLGVPFNIASYSLLTHMVAQQTGLVPGRFNWLGGDVHIYENHIEQCKLQMSRECRPLPRLTITRKPDSLFDYKESDFSISGYNPHPTILGKVAV